MLAGTDPKACEMPPDSRAAWHIITPEYPPSLGGVSDYSALVAEGLQAAGHEVHVWCPEPSVASTATQAGSVQLHLLPGCFGPRALRQLARGLHAFRASRRRLLVQWVPHGYGWRAMNLGFCFWILGRALRGDDVQIMLHEAFLSFRGGTWRQSVAATVQRLMTVILLASTRRVWVSSPSWEAKLRPYTLRSDVHFEWLPVPSTIPVSATEQAVDALRAFYTPHRESLIGHFGTYNPLTTTMLDRILPPLLSSHPECRLLLIGANGRAYRDRLVSEYPAYADRISATGTADADTVSRSLLACDLMIQPYPEGLTARRTTCLAGLSHGRPVVTTSGDMTEDFWRVEQPPVALGKDCMDAVRAADRLLGDHKERRRLGERAAAYYRNHFAVEHLVGMLQSASAAGIH